MDVNDRKLRARYRMLRHNERRSRLVLADGGRAPLWLGTFGGTKPERSGVLPRLMYGHAQE